MNSRTHQLRYCLPTPSLRQLWIVTLSMLLTVSARAADTQHIEIGLTNSGRNPLVQVEVEVQESDFTKSASENLSAIITKKSLHSSETIVVSSDHQELFENSLSLPQIDAQKIHFVALPQESQTAAAALPANPQDSKFLKLIKNYSQSALKAVKNDKIGFLILTYTTASESLIWIHSTHLSNLERSGNVIYSVALAIVFGLNKDSWAVSTRPIQKFFRNILKSDINKPASSKEFLTRFLGNATLGAVVTGIRIPLMSMDQIIQTGIKLHYFTMPLLMVIVSTAALFTWSENLAMINEKVKPISKFVFRRTNEIRSIIIGTFATTAALLNAAQYGSRPWIVMAAVGVTGALIYFNADTIHEWLEAQPWLQVLKADRAAENNKKSFQFRCEGLFTI